MDLFIWIENTALGEWVRTSMYAFPMLLTLHAIGLAFVVGVMAAISLRLLGFASGVPMAALTPFLKVAWLGFTLNLLSGLALFTADAHMFVTAGAFQIKIALVVLGLASILLSRRMLLSEGARIDGGGRAATGSRVLACAALVAWAGAIIAGRLIAYTASPF